MASTLYIHDCRLPSDPDRPTGVLIDGGTIVAVGVHDTPGATRFDAGGRLVSSGFIDLHIQGAGGADVLDGTPGALATMSATLARLGTTGFLGTTVAKPATGHEHLRVARACMVNGLEGAALLGVHLEGPFINLAKKGGIQPDGIYAYSPEALDAILAAAGESLRMMTIAPELPGALECIHRLADHGIIAAFAHSQADYDDLQKGCAAGITHVTHIFNAMNGLHHRAPGPVAAIVEHPSITVQIISDGHHIHPAMVRLMHRLIGTDRCACITDGLQGMGLPDGRYVYNGRAYDALDGVARYLDGTLIGTTMGLGEIARRFRAFTGCSVADALRTVTEVPARILGIDARKGSVAPGYDADLVLLNSDFSVHATLVAGHIVWRA